ncbi:hypothetical protein B0T13DRAFT_53106 [Neurospora crassa]|nr:hypothetical protein B0T13DRAFT_53106 [Neurospora crassa]
MAANNVFSFLPLGAPEGAVDGARVAPVTPNWIREACLGPSGAGRAAGRGGDARTWANEGSTDTYRAAGVAARIGCTLRNSTVLYQHGRAPWSPDCSRHCNTQQTQQPSPHPYGRRYGSRLRLEKKDMDWEFDPPSQQQQQRKHRRSGNTGGANPLITSRRGRGGRGSLGYRKGC